MNCHQNVYQLIDISSASEDEDVQERASTPLPKGIQPNYRVVVEISQPSVEVIAGEDDYFDLSLDSLESNCKKIESRQRLRIRQI